MSKQAHVFFLQSFPPHSHPKERKTDTRPAWEKVPQPFRSNFSHSTLAALSKFPSDWPELQYVPVAAATVSTDDEDNYMVTSAPSPKSRPQNPFTARSSTNKPPTLVNVRSPTGAHLPRQRDHRIHIHNHQPAREPELALHPHGPRSRHRGPAPRATDRSSDGTGRRSRVFTWGKRDERCGDIKLYQGGSEADPSRRLYMYECSTSYLLLTLRLNPPGHQMQPSSLTTSTPKQAKWAPQPTPPQL